jgi:hypothetical protein
MIAFPSLFFHVLVSPFKTLARLEAETDGRRSTDLRLALSAVPVGSFTRSNNSRCGVPAVSRLSHAVPESVVYWKVVFASLCFFTVTHFWLSLTAALVGTCFFVLWNKLRMKKR